MNGKSTKLKLCLRSAFMLLSALTTDLLLKGRLRLMTGAVICVMYICFSAAEPVEILLIKFIFGSVSLCLSGLWTITAVFYIIFDCVNYRNSKN